MKKGWLFDIMGINVNEKINVNVNEINLNEKINGMSFNYKHKYKIKRTQVNNILNKKATAADLLAFWFQTKNKLSFRETLLTLFPDTNINLHLSVSDNKLYELHEDKQSKDKQSKDKPIIDKYSYGLVLIISYTREGKLIEWHFRILRNAIYDFLKVKINGETAFGPRNKFSSIEITMAAHNMYLYDIPIWYCVTSANAIISKIEACDTLNNEKINEISIYVSPDKIRLHNAAFYTPNPTNLLKMNKWKEVFDIKSDELLPLLYIDRKTCEERYEAFLGLLKASNAENKAKINKFLNSNT